MKAGVVLGIIALVVHRLARLVDHRLDDRAPRRTGGRGRGANLARRKTEA